MIRLGPLLLLAVSGVLFPAGARLHLLPDADSLSVAVLDEAVELVPLEERDGWYRVRHLDRIGWVRQGPPYSLPEGRGGAMVPPGDGDDGLLRELYARFPGPFREVGLGPVLLVTDSFDPRLEADLSAGIARAEDGMALRFGFTLPRAGGPVLFLLTRPADAPRSDRRACGRTGLRVSTATLGGSATGNAVDGILHEAGHLFAAGVLGRDVPPWLEEGVAAAFVEASWPEESDAPARTALESSYARPSPCGPDRPPLSRLLRAGPELFRDDAAGACLRRESADLVRFLSDAKISRRPSRLRVFLKEVYAGVAILDTPSLLEALGEDLPTLERNLRETQRPR
jgi:hypothetical protein